MRNQIAVMISMIGVVLCALAYAGQTKAYSLPQNLGDLPLQGSTKDLHLSFSPGGREIIVELRNSALTTRGIRLIEPGKGYVPADDLFLIKQAIGLNPDHESLSVVTAPHSNGNWVVNGNIVGQAKARGIKKTFNVGKQQQIDSFFDAKGNAIRFVDAHGDALAPDTNLTSWYRRSDGSFSNAGFSGADGLFGIIDGRRQEITCEGSRTFSDFSYDTTSGRILVRGGAKGDVLYDMSKKDRISVPNFDQNTRAYRINHLVPGHDLLVTQTNYLNPSGDDYIGTSLTLRTLNDQLIFIFDTTYGVGQRSQEPAETLVSRHMVAFILSDGKRNYLRIYALK